jgi:hypothetical protein
VRLTRRAPVAQWLANLRRRSFSAGRPGWRVAVGTVLDCQRAGLRAGRDPLGGGGKASHAVAEDLWTQSAGLTRESRWSSCYRNLAVKIGAIFIARKGVKTQRRRALRLSSFASLRAESCWPASGRSLKPGLDTPVTMQLRRSRLIAAVVMFANCREFQEGDEGDTRSGRGCILVSESAKMQLSRIWLENLRRLLAARFGRAESCRRLRRWAQICLLFNLRSSASSVAQTRQNQAGEYRAPEDLKV